MQSIPLINKQALILSVLALCMNGLFLYIHNPNIYFAITQAHGQIGYNLYTHNMIGMDPELTEHMRATMYAQGKLIEYDTVVHQAYNKPIEPFPINDTVGYGVLLGLLWKITHSLRFLDVQILQISMFCILMLFYYQVAYLLFGSAQIAFACGLMLLLFFPLLAYNVMPVRDVWAYYGLLVLAYTVLSYLHRRISAVCMILCMIFFAGCLWIRPTLSLAAVMMSLFLGGYAYKNKSMRKRSMHLIATLWLVTGLLFWAPFMYYNMKQYNRLMVSPAGQSLLEGLGEMPNEWGHQLNDEYVHEFISNKYGHTYGTVAFDEAALHEFQLCVQENPWHYAKTLFYRLPDVMLPGLQWIFYEQSPYAHCHGIADKLRCVCSSWSNGIDFLLRHIWMRLYLLLGYLGLYFMWRDKRYMAAVFIITCLLSGLSTYPSHIEYRYIVPFYWVFSFFVGYLFCCSFVALRISMFSTICKSHRE